MDFSQSFVLTCERTRRKIKKMNMLKPENGSLPDLNLPDSLYEKTTANYILGKNTAD